VCDGGHGASDGRVVSQHRVEMLHGQRVDVAVRLGLNARRPSIIRQQTDLCTESAAFSAQLLQQDVLDVPIRLLTGIFVE